MSTEPTDDDLKSLFEKSIDFSGRSDREDRKKKERVATRTKAQREQQADKTEQENFRVTPEFKEFAKRVALAAKVPKAQMFELAVRKYAADLKLGR